MVIIWKTYYFNNKYGTRITHENSKTYFQLGPLKVYGKYFVFITVLRNVFSWACGHCLFYFLLAHWICDCPGLKAINGVSTLLAANWNTWTPFLYCKMVTLNGQQSGKCLHTEFRFMTLLFDFTPFQKMFRYITYVMIMPI